jgi:hypothetical protein
MTTWIQGVDQECDESSRDIGKKEYWFDSITQCMPQIISAVKLQQILHSHLKFPDVTDCCHESVIDIKGVKLFGQ